MAHNIFPNDVNIAPDCSVCLEKVVDDSTRSITKLICGHLFHTDCIGGEFNMKGQMICPNCRSTENGNWMRFKNSEDYETSDDYEISDDYETSDEDESSDENESGDEGENVIMSEDEKSSLLNARIDDEGSTSHTRRQPLQTHNNRLPCLELTLVTRGTSGVPCQCVNCRANP